MSSLAPRWEMLYILIICVASHLGEILHPSGMLFVLTVCHVESPIYCALLVLPIVLPGQFPHDLNFFSKFPKFKFPPHFVWLSSYNKSLFDSCLFPQVIQFLQYLVSKFAFANSLQLNLCQFPHAAQFLQNLISKFTFANSPSWNCFPQIFFNYLFALFVSFFID